MSGYFRDPVREDIEQLDDAGLGIAGASELCAAQAQARMWLEEIGIGVSKEEAAQNPADPENDLRDNAA